MGLIYKVISPSNKIYIGKTIQTLSDRRSQHYLNARKIKTKFYSALRKYKDQMMWLVLEDNLENSSLNQREIYWIKYYNSYKKGLNSTKGGDGAEGNKHSKEFKKRLSERMKLQNPMLGKYGPAHNRYGTKHTIDWKKQASSRMTSHNPMTNKFGESHPRPKLSNKTRKEIRQEYKVDKVTHNQLSKKYGVSKNTIQRIIAKGKIIC